MSLVLRAVVRGPVMACACCGAKRVGLYRVQPSNPITARTLAALFVVLTVIRTATGCSFNESESPDAEADASVQGSAAVTHGDVTLGVAAILADPIETAVELEFDGLPSGWAAIPAPEHRPYLEDSQGERFWLRQGALSGDSIHGGTLVFEPLIGAVSPVQLVVPKLTATEREGATGSSPELYGGEWRVEVPVGGVEEAPNRLVQAVERPLGPGSVVVESITVGSTGILVEGHLEGYSRDDVRASVLIPARLTNDLSRSVSLVGGYQGRGGDDLAFGLQFPPLSGDSFVLELTLSPAAGSAADGSSIDQFFGNRVTLPLVVE